MIGVILHEETNEDMVPARFWLFLHCWLHLRAYEYVGEPALVSYIKYPFELAR